MSGSGEQRLLMGATVILLHGVRSCAGRSGGTAPGPSVDVGSTAPPLAAVLATLRVQQA